MKSNMIFVILLTIASFYSCKGKKSATEDIEPNAPKDTITLEHLDTVPGHEIVVKDLGNGTLLVKSWTETLNKESINFLFKLDSAAQKSDGSLSEEIGVASASFYEKKPVELLEYLAKYPNSSLETKFTNELGINISIYEGNERTQEFNKVIERLLKEIDRTNLDSIQKNYLRLKMIKKIDPSKFD